MKKIALSYCRNSIVVSAQTLLLSPRSDALDNLPLRVRAAAYDRYLRVYLDGQLRLLEDVDMNPL